MVSPALAWLLRPAGGASGLDGLSEHELAALVVEGLVVAVAGTHLAADAAGFPAARAEALAPRLEPGTVVAGAAALWVRGAVAHCDVVDVYPARGRAGGSRRDPGWRRTRAGALPPEHVVRSGALLLTSLERTAADVALWHPRTTAGSLVRAAVAAGADPLAALESLTGAARPGQREGRRRLLEQLPAGSGLPAAGEAVHVEDPVDPAHRAEHVAQVRGVRHLEGEAGDRHAVA